MASHPDVPNLSAFFDALCEAAALETLPRFRTGTAVTNKEKSAFDPVTEGDRQAEKAIRKLITSTYPDHGIIGEEFGKTNESAQFQWIIDPIDGTRAFISGLPVWGTLIGLYRDGVPYAGVMDQPFTRERFKAVPSGAGLPSTSLSIGGGHPHPQKTRNTASLTDATLMTTSPSLFRENNEMARYRNLESKVNMARYGCDCYAYAMVAAGQIDLVVESGLNIYDIAALVPLIEGAGGVVSNWEGGDASQGGQILAAANPQLHSLAVEALDLGARHEGIEG